MRLRLFKANELKRVRVYDFEFHSQRNAPPVPFSNESRKERRRTRYPLIDSYFWIGFVKNEALYA